MEEEGMMALIMPIVVVMIMAVMIQGVIPTKTHCCPICGECFYTYDELYNHFITAHPAEPIDIIWE